MIISPFVIGFYFSDIDSKPCCFIEHPKLLTTPNDKLTGVRALSHVRLSDLLGTLDFCLNAKLHSSFDLLFVSDVRTI